MLNLLFALDGVVIGKILVLAGGVIIAIGLYWYSRVENEKAMKKLGSLLELDMIRIDDGVFDNEALKLRGLINEYDVGVINTPRYKQPHEIIVRIYLKRKNNATFKLTVSQGIQGIVDSLSGTDYIVGYDDFDKLYTLKTETPEFIHQLFDVHLSQDFAGNHETFKRSTIILHDEFIELREAGKVNKPAHVERLQEVVLFLLHIAEKIDSLTAKQNR